MGCNIFLLIIGCMILSASGSELLDRLSDVSARAVRISETPETNNGEVNETRIVDGETPAVGLFERERAIECYFDFDSFLPEEPTSEPTSEPTPEPISEPTSMRLRPFPVKIKVFWDKPEIHYGIDGYIINWGSDILVGAAIDLVGKNRRSYSIRNLQPSTEYRISVRAFNKFGAVGPPAVATASTKQLNLPIGIPKPPVGIKANATSPTTIVVTWDYPYQRVEDLVYSFQVRYKILGTQEANELTTASHLVNLQGLYSNTAYKIKVRVGHNRTHRLSAWSFPITRKTPN